jgi:hypothetical protein
MTIGTAGFRYVSTTTSGKLEIIDWQKQIVNRAYNKQPLDGRGVSLPGNSSGLKRHIQELTDYGIAEHNQIMVDWDYGIYLDLVAEAKLLGFKGKVMYGNAITVVRDLWQIGEQVDVIDFDHIAYLEPMHLKLLEDACKHDVKVFIGVFATRGHGGGFNQFHSNLIRQYNIKPYIHWRGNVTYSLKEIQGDAMHHTAVNNGYKCHYKGYNGRSTMVSCIVVK